MALETYRQKRRFGETPEPAGAAPNPDSGGRFCIQKHAARRLHYDLRLEINGVLRSWAVPKGPSLDPGEKRLAARTEDHPMEYLTFEKVIPPGNYGAGTMLVWDIGTFECEGDAAPLEQLERGEIKFALYGKKLRGSFVLVRTRRSSKSDKKAEEWLLIKHRDAAVDPDWRIEDHPASALTGRTLEEVAAGAPPDQAQAAGPAAFEDAVEGPPPQLSPMLATSAEKAFSDPDWLFELKWDGVRAQARLEGGAVRLLSRNGKDVTAHYPELAELPRAAAARSAVLDGEIVALDAQGRSDFARLQTRMHVQAPSRAQVQSAPVVFYLFDVVYLDGYDLRQVPLRDRKRLLREILHDSPQIRYCDHVVGEGEALYELASQAGAEGVIAKRADSAYQQGRSAEWLKIKAFREVDAVVGGWTDPRGGRDRFGALLVGLHGAGGLRFVGGVGTGFDGAVLDALAERLAPLASDVCPFTAVPVTKERAHWVRPQLVARVKYGSWTPDHILRHPVFLGLRSDMEPSDCIEQAMAAPETAKPRRRADALPTLDSREALEAELFSGRRETVVAEIDGKRVRLTHLDKVYFPKPGYTKRQVLAYYYKVADRILPFLENRPLVLHRFPNGIEAESFYQKDAGEGVPEWMDTVVIPSEGVGRDIRYFVVNDLAALLHLVNLGSIEFHPWPSRTDDLHKPDYVFFDLDPTEGWEYSTVVRVARAIWKRLEAMGLDVFLKTSGSEGMHLWLPLERNYDFDQARAFAEIVMRIVHAELPDETTLERVVDKRPKGVIYLDYSQNAYSRPLATVYSVRPKPLATVSAPLSAASLRSDLTPDSYTIESLPHLLEQRKTDPWAEFWNKRQSIEPALAKLRDVVSESSRNKA
ncbi:MAG: DNA ligase D [Acidobacteria bacterium]|nr:DNA ligase D [Acidobacteriota bacterium]